MLLLLGEKIVEVEEGVGVEVDKHVCGAMEEWWEEEISVWCDPLTPVSLFNLCRGV